MVKSIICLAKTPAPNETARYFVEAVHHTDFEEDFMNRFAGFFRRAVVCGGVLAVTLILAGIAGWAWPPSANSSQEAAKASDHVSLLEGFRHVEAASVSDALEQISGRKMYMTHRMRPIFPTKFAGFNGSTSGQKKNRDCGLDKVLG